MRASEVATTCAEAVARRVELGVPGVAVVVVEGVEGEVVFLDEIPGGGAPAERENQALPPPDLAVAAAPPLAAVSFFSAMFA